MTLWRVDSGQLQNYGIWEYIVMYQVISLLYKGGCIGNVAHCGGGGQTIYFKYILWDKIYIFYELYWTICHFMVEVGEGVGVQKIKSW